MKKKRTAVIIAAAVIAALCAVIAGIYLQPRSEVPPDEQMPPYPEVLTFDWREIRSVHVRTFGADEKTTVITGLDKNNFVSLINQAEYTFTEEIEPYTGTSVVVYLYYYDGPDGERVDKFKPHYKGIDYHGYHYYSDIGMFIREYLYERYYYERWPEDGKENMIGDADIAAIYERKGFRVDGIYDDEGLTAVLYGPYGMCFDWFDRESGERVFALECGQGDTLESVRLTDGELQVRTRNVVPIKYSAFITDRNGAALYETETRRGFVPVDEALSFGRRCESLVTEVTGRLSGTVYEIDVGFGGEDTDFLAGFPEIPYGTAAADGGILRYEVQGAKISDGMVLNPPEDGALCSDIRAEETENGVLITAELSADVVRWSVRCVYDAEGMPHAVFGFSTENRLFP